MILYTVQSIHVKGELNSFTYDWLYTLDPDKAVEGVKKAIEMRELHSPGEEKEYYYRIMAEPLDSFNGELGFPVKARYFAPNGAELDPDRTPFDAQAYERGEVFYIDDRGLKRYWNGLMWTTFKPLNIR